MSLPSAKKRKIFDDRYEVIAIVGRGLDSVVYQARHLGGTQQEVALKVLINNKPKNSMTERLRKEALTLVSCRHKFVVRLDDFHSVADLCYLSMEFAPFGDLRKYIAGRGSPLSPESGELFLRQALEALDFVHATGVLHRDIKPDNVLVISEKEIRLADFGLALLPGDEIDLKELQNGVGSMDYIPPELLDGERYDSRSDLYSLGVCFYEALAGFHPFAKAPLSEQKSIRLDATIKPLNEVNPAIPANVSAVVASLMRYSAGDRFQSAPEALRALSDPDFRGTASPTNSENNPADFNSGEDVREEIGSRAPANSDKTEHDFTTNFDDFFKEFDEANSSAAGADDPVASEPSKPTEEISPQRVQQLIEQDAIERASTAMNQSESDTRNYYAGDREFDFTNDFDEEIVSNEDKAGGRARWTDRRGRVGSLVVGSHSLARSLMVGGIAAVVTIAAVLVAHLRASDPIPTDSRDSATMNNEEATEPQTASAADGFPRVSSGTYAGNIQGVLPGVISPLALISRPEHNELVVVIGIEGWSPATVSTLSDGDAPSSTVVVRSNGVVLSLTGTTSLDEITGTFSNAITGESGVWRVRKSS
jgi:serine/threonine protein kinase